MGAMPSSRYSRVPTPYPYGKRYMPAQPRSPRGLLAVGLFLCFAATASAYAGVTLLFPGTTLDRAWALNPKAHQQLASLGHLIGVAFLLLAAIFVFDAVGWFRRRRWAWRLTVVIIALQVLG